MTYVLTSGGLTALAGRRSRLRELRSRGQWPPHLPVVVLAESLTGDPRRDHATDQIVRLCLVTGVDEPLAREAGRLRTATRRAGSVSAVDALVAAYAGTLSDARILTSDPADMLALIEHGRTPVAVVRA